VEKEIFVVNLSGKKNSRSKKKEGEGPRQGPRQKGPPTTQHVFNRERNISAETDPDLPEIMVDIGKHETLTDGFDHFQELKFCPNTLTQYINTDTNIPSSDHFLSVQYQHIDRTLVNTILQKTYFDIGPHTTSP
jgi:hypothetical protein